MKFSNRLFLPALAAAAMCCGTAFAEKIATSQARIGGEWKTVYADGLNILRLRKVSFDPIDVDALRIVVAEAWGGGKAHVFAFDAR